MKSIFHEILDLIENPARIPPVSSRPLQSSHFGPNQGMTAKFRKRSENEHDYILFGTSMAELNQKYGGTVRDYLISSARGRNITHQVASKLCIDLLQDYLSCYMFLWRNKRLRWIGLDILPA